MKLTDILVLGGVGVAGYFAWQWYQGQQAAGAASGTSSTTALQPQSGATTALQPQSSATTALPPASGQTSALNPTGMGSGYYGTWGQDPDSMPWGYPDNTVMGVTPYGGAPFVPPAANPMAFAKWYASRSPQVKAHLAPLSYAQKQAAYHAYVANFHAHLAKAS
jgi:hypothetical protein